MKIEKTKGWEDYGLLDSGNGKRLERFGAYRLARPDPQCLWSPSLSRDEWEKADAVFGLKADGKEGWTRKTAVPERWNMTYKDVTFAAKLSPFKHTGVFPEQHLQWDFMKEIMAKSEKLHPKREQLNVLNLFGYTGIASLVCAAAGAKVTHVDASHPTIGWARENQRLSGLTEKPIRWILDDCSKFVAREAKRGIRYDGIIMDPPVFGHGPDGQRWEFFESLPGLLDSCKAVLTETPLFIVMNAYAISASSIMLDNILMGMTQEYSGKVTSGELALEEETSDRLLSTGIFARWSALA